MTNTAQRRQKGFVLVIVLAILVVLALLAAATATSSERAIRAAQDDADRFAFECDMESSKQTILYMLATQRQTLGGLTTEEANASATLEMIEDVEGLLVIPTGKEIKLDGTAYRGFGNTLFSLQDDRGLISPNWTTSAIHSALLASLGAPADQWNGLSAKRLDYQDPDDMHRLNGAEKSHYAAAALAPPTNMPLQTPLEFRRIIGWNTLLEPYDDTYILSTISLAQGADLNINTAPANVLALIPEIGASNAARIVEMRKSSPFHSVYQLQQVIPLGPEIEDGLNVFAKPSGNLTLWNEKFGARHMMHWTLTPLEVGGPPWRIDYEVVLPRGKESDQAVANTPSTPLFATQNPG